jgi:hypothetical protein
MKTALSQGSGKATEGIRPKRISFMSISLVQVQPNAQVISEFLNALGTSHTFQTFGEGATKGKAASQVLNGSWSDHASNLLNLNSKGVAVYVTVSQTDGKGRQKSNITAPRALFLDFDDTEPDSDKLALLPEPSAVIQSKRMFEKS